MSAFMCMGSLSAGILAFAIPVFWMAEASCLAGGLEPDAAKSSAALPIGSVKELFADVDPRKDPLEIEMIKEWDEEGIHIEQLYFTGQIFGGVKTRVYAYCGAPKEGMNLPGILHCHGGGQTAYLDWVRFWAKRGYVCVSFDYSGDTNKNPQPEYKREHFTRWGEAVEKMMSNYASAPPDKRDPRGCNWYHFCRAGRRALTLLELHPQVDPTHIGAFGISAGGYLCWLVAGTDARIKTIVPIYGHAAGIYRDAEGRRIKIADPDFEKKKFQSNPDAPELYAPSIKCPVFYMSATNDGAFNADYSFDTLDRLEANTVRQIFTPRYSHHMQTAEGRTLPLWMDWQLKKLGGPWPATPEVEFAVEESLPKIKVKADRVKDIAKVDIYYALNNTWAITRFWRDGENPRRKGGIYIADAPFMHPTDRIYVLANVTYRSGVKLSSRIVEIKVADLPGAKPTLEPETLIDAMQDANDWHWVPAYPDPKIYDEYLRDWIGPNGEKGFTVAPFDCENPPFVDKDGTLRFCIGTHKIGDPQWGGAGHRTLILDYLASAVPTKLKIKIVIGNYSPSQKEYSFEPKMTPTGSRWEAIRMENGFFKDKDGASLDKWDQVRFLELSGVAAANNTPVFRNLRWGD